jgi:subtilisin family serine protease
MVAQFEADHRDSRVIEIEFRPDVPHSRILDFITSVNNQNITVLAQRRAGDELYAAFAFEGPDHAADSLEPRRDRFVAVRVPDGGRSSEVATQLMASFPEIKAAARRPMFIPAAYQPSDPLLGHDDQRPPGSPHSQWYLYRCAAVKAWDYSAGNGVVVADIDWGFRLGHEDIAGRFDPQGLRNVLRNNDNVSIGDLQHGTGAAGLIGAGANGSGIVGFAPKCILWLLQAGEIAVTTPTTLDELCNPWATAVEWVVSAPSSMRKVINVEIQTGMRFCAESSIALQGAIRRAVAAQVFVCVPAGNGNVSADCDENGTPIPYTGSIVVAATGYDAKLNPRARFSNFGKRVSVAAPGEPSLDLTCGAGSNSDYTEGYGGTSGASAKVAGALALALSRNPQLTPADLLKILDGLPANVYSKVPIGKFLDCAALSKAAYSFKATATASSMATDAGSS